MAQRRRSPSVRRRGGNGNGKKPSILIVSGGAPHAALLAGALCAVFRAGKTFDAVWASGGGALIALLLVAPKDRCADDALRRVVDFGVSNSIYDWFPVGYKTFFKVGPFAQPFRKIAQHLHLETAPHPFPDEPKPTPSPHNEPRRRFFNDLVDFAASVLTPTTFPFSTGLCEPLPFLEEVIDFDRANQPHSPSGFPPKGNAPWFYVNAFNLRTCQMEQFETGRLSPATIRAALAFPLVYPAQEINGEPYCEGADHDPINLLKLDAKVEEAKLKPVNYYVFDILGSIEKELLERQHSLWSAFGLSLVVPVVSLAVKCLEIWDPEYREKIEPRPRQRADRTSKATYVNFQIPPSQKGRVLEWSYENASALWDAGFESGKELIRKYGSDLPDRLDKVQCRPAATGSR